MLKKLPSLASHFAFFIILCGGLCQPCVSIPEISAECSKVLIPALNKISMHLDDLDNPSKVIEFKKAYKNNTLEWAKIRSKCVKSDYSSLTASPAASHCPCKNKSGNCSAVFSKCFWDCDACTI